MVITIAQLHRKLGFCTVSNHVHFPRLTIPQNISPSLSLALITGKSLRRFSPSVALKLKFCEEKGERMIFGMRHCLTFKSSHCF